MDYVILIYKLMALRFSIPGPTI